MGLFSDLFGIGKGGSGQADRNAAIIELQKVGVPDPESMYVQIKDLVQQGVITPEELDTYVLGPTAFGNIHVDPQYIQAQVDSLNKLKEISDAGGLDAIDKSKIREIQDELRATSRGNIEAIRQNARETGAGGSDFDLVSRQMASQNAANTASKEGTDVAALAEQRKLDAIKAQAELGGQLQTQQYGEQADLAKAKDAIEAFNTSNKQNVAATNVTNANTAAEKNLNAKQNISNTNTAAANAEALRRSGLTQQDFTNRLNKALGIAGQYNANANASDAANAQRGAADLAGWSSLIGAGATLGAGALMSDENQKEDIHPAAKNLDDFMSEIHPAKFKYKDKRNGEGERFGTMAQDVEHTAVGKTMVKDTPDGKMLDNEATLSALLAAVGRLAHRLDSEGK